MKKYIVIGCEVMSAWDGDIHYVSAPRLCTLYKINPDECYLLETSDGRTVLPHWLAETNLPVLSARADGNYTLPESY